MVRERKQKESRPQVLNRAAQRLQHKLGLHDQAQSLVQDESTTKWFTAALIGDLDTLKQLKLMGSRDMRKTSMLYVNSASMEFNTNRFCINGATALMYSAISGQADCVAYLSNFDGFNNSDHSVAVKTELNMVDKNGFTALMHCCGTVTNKIVSKLANIVKSPPNYQKVIKILLNILGRNVPSVSRGEARKRETITDVGYTALMLAVRNPFYTESVVRLEAIRPLVQFEGGMKTKSIDVDSLKLAKNCKAVSHYLVDGGRIMAGELWNPNNANDAAKQEMETNKEETEKLNELDQLEKKIDRETNIDKVVGEGPYAYSTDKGGKTAFVLALARPNVGLISPDFLSIVLGITKDQNGQLVINPSDILNFAEQICKYRDLYEMLASNIAELSTPDDNDVNPLLWSIYTRNLDAIDCIISKMPISTTIGTVLQKENRKNLPLLRKLLLFRSSALLTASAEKRGSEINSIENQLRDMEKNPTDCITIEQLATIVDKSRKNDDATEEKEEGEYGLGAFCDLPNEYESSDEMTLERLCLEVIGVYDSVTRTLMETLKYSGISLTSYMQRNTFVADILSDKTTKEMIVMAGFYGETSSTKDDFLFKDSVTPLILASYCGFSSTVRMFLSHDNIYRQTGIKDKIGPGILAIIYAACSSNRHTLKNSYGLKSFADLLSFEVLPQYAEKLGLKISDIETPYKKSILTFTNLVSFLQKAIDLLKTMVSCSDNRYIATYSISKNTAVYLLSTKMPAIKEILMYANVGPSGTGSSQAQNVKNGDLNVSVIASGHLAPPSSDPLRDETLNEIMSTRSNSPSVIGRLPRNMIKQIRETMAVRGIKNADEDYHLTLGKKIIDYEKDITQIIDELNDIEKQQEQEQIQEKTYTPTKPGSVKITLTPVSKKNMTEEPPVTMPLSAALLASNNDKPVVDLQQNIAPNTKMYIPTFPSICLPAAENNEENEATSVPSMCQMDNGKKPMLQIVTPNLDHLNQVRTVSESKITHGPVPVQHQPTNMSLQRIRNLFKKSVVYSPREEFNSVVLPSPIVRPLEEEEFSYDSQDEVNDENSEEEVDNNEITDKNNFINENENEDNGANQDFGGKEDENEIEEEAENEEDNDDEEEKEMMKIKAMTKEEYAEYKKQKRIQKEFDREERKKKSEEHRVQIRMRLLNKKADITTDIKQTNGSDNAYTAAEQIQVPVLTPQMEQKPKQIANVQLVLPEPFLLGAGNEIDKKDLGNQIQNNRPSVVRPALILPEIPDFSNEGEGNNNASKELINRPVMFFSNVTIPTYEDIDAANRAQHMSDTTSASSNRDNNLVMAPVPQVRAPTQAPSVQAPQIPQATQQPKNNLQKFRNLYQNINRDKR